MKGNKRLLANIVEIVVGIILLILGIAGVLDSYWCGMGTALIVVGTIMLVRQIRYRTNAEYKKSVDVEANDERNQFLRVKAWSWAGYLFVLAGAFASVIFRVLDMNQYSQFSAYCVCLIMVLYWLSYLVLQKRH